MPLDRAEDGDHPRRQRFAADLGHQRPVAGFEASHQGADLIVVEVGQMRRDAVRERERESQCQAE